MNLVRSNDESVAFLINVQYVVLGTGTYLSLACSFSSIFKAPLLLLALKKPAGATDKAAEVVTIINNFVSKTMFTHIALRVSLSSQ